MEGFGFLNIIFYALFAIIVLSAGVVAFSTSILYSGFALLGAFGGVAGLFFLVGADFLGAVQLMVYVGGILIVILFAVMLTTRIVDVEVTNQGVGRWKALVITGALTAILLYVVLKAPWTQPVPGSETASPALAGEVLLRTLGRAMEMAQPKGTTVMIGEALLSKYLVAFEAVSVVLVATLVGAALIIRKESRRKKEADQRPGVVSKGEEVGTI